MDQQELDLGREWLNIRDRKSRIFNCFKAAAELIHANKDACNLEQNLDLLDFLAEEYVNTGVSLLRMIDAERRSQLSQGRVPH